MRQGLERRATGCGVCVCLCCHASRGMQTDGDDRSSTLRHSHFISSRQANSPCSYRMTWMIRVRKRGGKSSRIAQLMLRVPALGGSCQPAHHPERSSSHMASKECLNLRRCLAHLSMPMLSELICGSNSFARGH